MLRRIRPIAMIAGASLWVAACGFETGRDMVAPSSSGSGGSSSTAPAVGVWNSLSFTPPDPKSCGNFEWKITSQTPTSMAGDFSASCMNGAVEITGSASGHINGTIVPITASGQATGAGLTPGRRLQTRDDAVPPVELRFRNPVISRRIPVGHVESIAISCQLVPDPDSGSGRSAVTPEI